MARPHRRAARRSFGLAGLLVALLASCGGSGGEKGADPKIRLLNLSSGYSSLDMMTNVDAVAALKQIGD